MGREGLAGVKAWRLPGCVCFPICYRIRDEEGGEHMADPNIVYDALCVRAGQPERASTNFAAASDSLQAGESRIYASISASYFVQRIGMAVMALALPPWLMIGGGLSDIEPSLTIIICAAMPCVMCLSASYGPLVSFWCSIAAMPPKVLCRWRIGR